MEVKSSGVGQNEKNIYIYIEGEEFMWIVSHRPHIIIFCNFIQQQSVILLGSSSIDQLAINSNIIVRYIADTLIIAVYFGKKMKTEDFCLEKDMNSEVLILEWENKRKRK